MTKTFPRSRYASGPRTGLLLAGVAGLVFVVLAPGASGSVRADTLSGVPLEEIHNGLDIHGHTGFLTIITALSHAGYEIVSTDVTLLNRVRIRARNNSHLREIVVSRASGRVLRDVVVQTFSTSTPVPLEELLEFLPDGTVRVRQDGN